MSEQLSGVFRLSAEFLSILPGQHDTVGYLFQRFFPF